MNRLNLNTIYSFLSEGILEGKSYLIQVLLINNLRF
jgi:hypothetical protein